MALNANDAMSSYRPFGHHWLDCAIQETLLPGSPWQQVYDKLGQALAKRIQPELADSTKRAAIFDLLGSGFLQKYLSKWAWSVPTQKLDSLSPDERKLILQSTQLLLKEKLDLAAADCGYLIPKKKTGSKTPSSSPPQQQAPRQVPEEVIDTISKMADIFGTGMHRYVVQEGLKDHLLATTDSEQNATTQLTQLKRDNFRSTKVSPTLGDTTTVDSLQIDHNDDFVPNCWGSTSDLLGKSLCAILRRDPHRLDEICGKLSGRQLPGSLRHRIWNEVMLRNYKDAHQGEKSSEWFLRKNFAKTVLRGKAELKIDSTTKSPIDGLLETAIQEKYSSTPCMLKHKCRGLTREAQDALNVLYVYDRSYQPYYINWLYPLQLAVQDKNNSSSSGDSSGKDDRPYELALQLHLLRGYTFPRWSEILAVAQDVMQTVEREDPEFFAHLMMCSRNNVKIDPKDFLVQQIQNEQQRAASMTGNIANNPGAGTSDENKEREILASPVMFLRKWLGEGFVGVCDTNAILYMWDQCFMAKWSQEVLRRLCLSLLMLLRKRFMSQAQDYHGMKQIFLGAPGGLYTLDIQKAFQHLQSEGALADVPSINRQTENGPEKKSLSPTHTHKNTSKQANNVGPETPAKIHVPTSKASTMPLQTEPSFSPQTPPTNVTPPTTTVMAPPTTTSPATPTSAPHLQLSPAEEQVQVEQHDDGLVQDPISNAEIEDETGHTEQENGTILPVDGQSPLPSPTPEDPEPAWVTFDHQMTSDLPVALIPREGFDFYIDGVRFLPDNATIVKVAGRLIHGDASTPLDLPAEPSLKSLRVCPRFINRTLVGEGKPGQIAELRVYTVDKAMHQVVLVGTALLPIYNDRTRKLNIGGHQLRLKSGYPVPGQPILPQSVSHLPAVPGCSLLVRLLPHSEDFQDAPPYSSGFYQSDACKPNESEMNVIKHYKARSDWSKTEKDAAIHLAREEEDDQENPSSFTMNNVKAGKIQDKWSKLSDAKLRRWIIERLASSKLPKGKAPPLLDLVRCVNYDQDGGVAVKIRTAFGLQVENRYSVVLTRLLSGPKARQLAAQENDVGVVRRETFLTKEMDMDSLMRAPKWKDSARVLHPAYDEQSVLLLQFFGLAVTYQVDPSGRSKGVVKGPKGKGPVQLDGDSYLGWGVLPLFDRGCVVQGTYVLPIFQDTRDRSFLKGLLDAPSLESWVRRSLEKKTIKVHPNHPSAIVSVWDAHFFQGQTVPLPKRENFLRLAGDFNQFSATSQKKGGVQVNRIVLQSLPSAVQSEGVTSQKYLQEKDNFLETMDDLVTKMMENALLSSGQSPLTS